MRADPADGLLAIGETGRYLGGRPGADIPVAPDGFVDPGMEGMSVAPTPVENLPRHPRPPDFGGTGEDPVFELDTKDLPGNWPAGPTRPTRKDNAVPEVMGLLAGFSSSHTRL